MSHQFVFEYLDLNVTLQVLQLKNLTTGALTAIMFNIKVQMSWQSLFIHSFYNQSIPRQSVLNTSFAMGVLMEGGG